MDTASGINGQQQLATSQHRVETILWLAATRVLTNGLSRMRSDSHVRFLGGFATLLAGRKHTFLKRSRSRDTRLLTRAFQKASTER